MLRYARLSCLHRIYTSCSLNSLRGVFIWGIIEGTFLEAMKGDTQSLDYSSYDPYHEPPETLRKNGAQL